MVPREELIEQRLDGLEGKVDDGFRRIDKKIDDGFKRADERIEKVDARIERVDKKIDRLTFVLLAALLGIVVSEHAF